MLQVYQEFLSNILAFDEHPHQFTYAGIQESHLMMLSGWMMKHIWGCILFGLTNCAILMLEGT